MLQPLSNPFSGVTGSLDPFDFFAGRTVAWGIFEDRFGKLRRRFHVSMDGTWNGDEFVLDEVFIYDDGHRDDRTWRLKRTGAGTFTGQCEDCIGEMSGRFADATIEMSYVFALKVNGRVIPVRLLDRLYRLTNRAVMNRTRISKWGVNIGELSVQFEKVA